MKTAIFAFLLAACSQAGVVTVDASAHCFSGTSVNGSDMKSTPSLASVNLNCPSPSGGPISVSSSGSEAVGLLSASLSASVISQAGANTTASYVGAFLAPANKTGYLNYVYDIVINYSCCEFLSGGLTVPFFSVNFSQLPGPGTYRFHDSGISPVFSTGSTGAISSNVSIGGSSTQAYSQSVSVFYSATFVETSPAAAVPEPSSLLLCALGLLMLGWKRSSRI